MPRLLKNFDQFSKNVILVFAGVSAANFLNLLYQLILAHKLSAPDFAVFNSLLSVFMLVASPLGTLQLALAKYTSEFRAHQQNAKIRSLLSEFFKKAIFLSAVSLVISAPAVFAFMEKIKFFSFSSGILLSGLIAVAFLSPVFLGAVQGLEFFGWMTSSALVSGFAKLLLTFTFLALGFNISGALGAFLFASALSVLLQYFPLRKFLGWHVENKGIDYRRVLAYLFPVACANFCFIGLVSFDMVLVRYYFSPQDSGFYSLAQMIGKIFLFLPGAVSLVMFPRTSGLKAQEKETRSTLQRSLFYVFILCLCAVIFFNCFPGFVFKVLTGKIYAESVVLGRFFAFSMSLFAGLFILINYLLSLHDLRFIKYLAFCTVLQFLAIAYFHQSLVQVQLVLCLNSVLLFAIHFLLAFKKAGKWIP